MRVVLLRVGIDTGSGGIHGPLFWFTVATPIGAYNPDWAIVMEDPDGGDDLLYLVRETKGTLDIDALRPDEKRKILRGRKHFRDTLEMGQTGYRVITEAEQLPDGGV